LDEERYHFGSLTELMMEQEQIIQMKTADYIVARRSLEKARTQYLVLENYHADTQLEVLAEAETSLRALSDYVRQLEDHITEAQALVKAYRRARTDQLPWRRAARWVGRQVRRAVHAIQTRGTPETMATTPSGSMPPDESSREPYRAPSLDGADVHATDQAEPEPVPQSRTLRLRRLPKAVGNVDAPTTPESAPAPAAAVNEPVIEHVEAPAEPGVAAVQEAEETPPAR
jgi:hypothetical protein